MKKYLLLLFILCFAYTAQAPAAEPAQGADWSAHANGAGHKPAENRYYAQVRNGKSDKKAETARIMYLIEEVRRSPYGFLRNGEMHTGREAANHLQMKYGFARGQVKTAEEFVEHIAARSSISGEPYYLENHAGERLTVREVLMQELEHLDGALAEEAQPETGSSGL